MQFNVATDGVAEGCDLMNPTVSSTFPQKLYVMSIHEFDNAGSGIRWCANGRAFKVTDSEVFSDVIIPKYFKRKSFS